MMRPVHLAAALALCAAGCSSSTSSDADGARTGVRLVNATGLAIEATIGDRTTLANVAEGQVTAVQALEPGTYTLSARVIGQPGRGTAVAQLSVVAGRTVTAAILRDSTTIAASTLADTGAIVPAGKSKLRVVHLARGAPPLDVWRTQPDFQSPTRVQFPFVYGDVSPYLQSDAGAWEAWVTGAGTTTPKLATSGAVSLPSGGRATVIFVDSAGIVRANVVVE